MSSTLTVTNLTATNVTDGGGTTSTFANINSGSAKVSLYSPATSASISDSFNISSIDDDGTGEQGANITSALSSANYTTTVGLETTNLHNTGASNRTEGVHSKTTSTVNLRADFSSGSLNLYNGGHEGAIFYNLAVHGDLA